MTTNPPPLPASVKRALRGFNDEQVKQARVTLVDLARSCSDPKTRKDAAEYIDKVARQEELEWFSGTEDALVQLTGLPLEQRADAAMQMFARNQMSRSDLDTVLSTIKADQTARIAQLERDNRMLENENRDYAAMVEGKRIDGTPIKSTPVVDEQVVEETETQQ